MKLAILETGAPPDDIRERFGDYPGMFRRLLGEDAYEYATFDVADGRLPGTEEELHVLLLEAPQESAPPVFRARHEPSRRAESGDSRYPRLDRSRRLRTAMIFLYLAIELA